MTKTILTVFFLRHGVVYMLAMRYERRIIMPNHYLEWDRPTGI